MVQWNIAEKPLAISLLAHTPVLCEAICPFPHKDFTPHSRSFIYPEILPDGAVCVWAMHVSVCVCVCV